MKKEYIVSLKKDIDYNQFWREMEETISNHEFVPTRPVEIVNNRDLSVRSCHYSLTDLEAKTLREDPRVEAVLLPAPPNLRSNNAIQIADFSRESIQFPNVIDPNLVNWGLRRMVVEDIESQIGNSYPYCLDGTGVDVVIQDDGVFGEHPEFQDKHGNSRFIALDWYAAAGVAGTMPSGHYGNVGAHGTHVAGIAAGKTYGWAKGANVYSIRYDLFENISDVFDLIKTWHLNKPVDPKTGFKRPTIVNQSWGYRWFYDNAIIGGNLTDLVYRGISRGTTLRDIYGNINAAHGFHYTPSDVDQQELTDAGVICVKASGNYYHKVDAPGGVDYDNHYIYDTTWGYVIDPSTPIYYHRGSSPWSTDTIVVANVDSQTFNGKEQVAESSERGPGVDYFAPGTDITSCTNGEGFYGYTTYYPENDGYRIARISGTSMAAPQITGMLALFLQVNPGADITQCRAWLDNFSSKLNKLYSTELLNDYTNTRSLMGQENKFPFFPIARENGFRQTGNIIKK